MQGDSQGNLSMSPQLKRGGQGGRLPAALKPQGLSPRRPPRIASAFDPLLIYQPCNPAASSGRADQVPARRYAVV